MARLRDNYGDEGEGSADPSGYLDRLDASMAEAEPPSIEPMVDLGSFPNTDLPIDVDPGRGGETPRERVPQREPTEPTISADAPPTPPPPSGPSGGGAVPRTPSTEPSLPPMPVPGGGAAPDGGVVPFAPLPPAYAPSTPAIPRSPYNPDIGSVATPGQGGLYGGLGGLKGGGLGVPLDPTSNETDEISALIKMLLGGM